MTGQPRDLITLRDHARRRAGWEKGRPLPICSDKYRDHERCSGNLCGCECHQPTDAERRLWTQIADEIDAYLALPAMDGQEALI